MLELLSPPYAAIPNHWAPVRAVGLTAVADLAHVLSTVLLGLALGLLSWRLSNHFAQVAGWATPVLLIGMRLLYALSGPSHRPPDPATPSRRGKHFVLGLTLTMFLTPCLEGQTFFLMAGTRGPSCWRCSWPGA